MQKRKGAGCPPPFDALRPERARQRLGNAGGITDFGVRAPIPMDGSCGNYPGVEIRVYGSKGAAVARLISEYGIAESLHFATADAGEFRKIELLESHYAKGTSLKTPWPELYYRNLVRHFVDEILEGRPQECTFFDGAKSQEIVDAIIKAHFERRWVDIPGRRA